MDVLIELFDGRLILVEVKSALSVDGRAWKNLDKISQELSDRLIAKVVLYMGQKAIHMHRPQGDLLILPVSSLWRHPDPVAAE